MKLGHHKLLFGWLDQPKAFQKGLSLVLIYSLIVPSFTWSNPLIEQSDEASSKDKNAPTASMKKAILMLPSVQGALSKIGNLNQAMRIAAVNPNDEWRREEVRNAMRAVPLAVQEVAASFSSNVMGNSALPFVLSLMGGFVDVDAPNSFDKFLKNPSSDLIPSVGTEFPAEYLGEEGDVSIVLNEKQTVSSALTNEKIERTSGKLSADTVELTSRNLASLASVAIPAVKADSTPVLSVVEAQDKSEVPSVSPVVSNLHQDLQLVEAVVSQTSELRASTQSNLGNEESPELDISKDKKESAKKREKRKRTLLRKPTSWLLSPVFQFASILFESEAHAEQGGPGAGMGGGPQSNPQDQSGGGAATILTGIAAIIAAVSPIVVASQQAQSEQKIAKIESQTQIQQAEIQSQTQKDLANLNSQTALTQAQMQRETAQMNNDSQTQRLQMNLAASQMQRNEERQSQAEQLAIQRQMEEQKIAIQKMQADESIRMAREFAESQKLAALLQGADPRSVQSASSTGATGNPLAAALAAQATNSSLGSGQTMGSNSSASTSRTTARGLAGVAVNTVAAGEESAPARLLASVDSPLNGLEQNPAVRRTMRKGLLGRRALAGVAMGGRAPLRTAQGLYSNGLNPMAAGSFGGRALNARKSDLIQFAAEQKPTAESFVEYQNNRIRSMGSAQRH